MRFAVTYTRHSADNVCRGNRACVGLRAYTSPERDGQASARATGCDGVLGRIVRVSLLGEMRHLDRGTIRGARDYRRRSACYSCIVPDTRRARSTDGQKPGRAQRQSRAALDLDQGSWWAGFERSSKSMCGELQTSRAPTETRLVEGTVCWDGRCIVAKEPRQTRGVMHGRYAVCYWRSTSATSGLRPITGGYTTSDDDRGYVSVMSCIGSRELATKLVAASTPLPWEQATPQASWSAHGGFKTHRCNTDSNHRGLGTVARKIQAKRDGFMITPLYRGGATNRTLFSSGYPTSYA